MSIFIDSAAPWDAATQISSFEHAIQNVIAAGVTVVASANNHANSNCTTSPARLGYNNYFQSHSDPWRSAPYRVITVGGTDQKDRVWRCTDWSDCYPAHPKTNTGRCVDVYAPAHDVKVAYFGTACTPGVPYWRTGTPACPSRRVSVLIGTGRSACPPPGGNKMPCYRPAGGVSSGTSFAAPAVAGYAVRLLEANPAWTPAQVWNQIRLDSTWLPFGFDGDGYLNNDRILYAWPNK